MDKRILEELQVTRHETTRLLSEIRNWSMYTCVALIVGVAGYAIESGWFW